MPEHVLMSEIEINTDGGRRRRWGAAEKLRIVEETLDGRASVSAVARRNGVAPNLLYRWRRLMLEGGSVAVTRDDDVTSNRVVRQLEERVRDGPKRTVSCPEYCFAAFSKAALQRLPEQNKGDQP